MGLISFNNPSVTGKEIENVAEALTNRQFAGNGSFTKRCEAWLERQINCTKALLTNSCTAALEMAAVLADIQPGDEVIMPSYTFVSTANAFVARGAIPVFIDVRSDTLNIDERLIEPAITSRTRAIVPVHYGGVGCNMTSIKMIAERYNLWIIEDAAQAIMATQEDQALGSFGHLGTLSFHETKNITSGEGGALLINDTTLVNRAEIIREKGTNRSQFLRGQIDKYTWVDMGSSHLPSEIIAAFLWAQLQEALTITKRRLALWENYHSAFEPFEKTGRVRRPIIPNGSGHNGHHYYLLLSNLYDRDNFIKSMRQQEIECVFHYVPLHSSPFGRQSGRASGPLPVTKDISDRIVRMPLWVELEEQQDRVVEAAVKSLKKQP